ncbi:MAG: hypothetical protein CO140_04415 [Candidatus Moranbacteria bacterium CG_4_9_14_3_um_filter_40_7]|nr:MAG: hypothetical protein CO140_04415 [Candidatus Moranbacteria bacterium CG_4_9_14_3_um_filter_40_7]
MDIISHALWCRVVAGRKSKKYFWWAFAFGLFPDAASFGILMAARILNIASGPDWSNGRPDASLVPQFVHILYNLTHSFITFGLIFLLVWWLLRKPFWPLAAWGFHIFLDIPSHSYQFFPTPFLWPFSSFEINGINWGEPIVFIPNLIFLILLYAVWGASWWKKSKI